MGPLSSKKTSANNEEQGTIVEINHQALVNILTRYPGPFDVFRELIQNADDAEAQTVEIYFETAQSVATTVDISQIKVHKWIIKNNGKPLEKDDWGRLRKIAEGNRNSSKVGAFGVGFYIVLSVCDKPLVKSNGKFLQLTRGDELRVKMGSSKANGPDAKMTSIELDLKSDVHEPLPKLADLARFLVSSITFLDKVHTISVFLNNWTLLSIRKEREAPTLIENLKYASRILAVRTIDYAIQRVTVDAVEHAFPKSQESVDESDDEDDQVASLPKGSQTSNISAPTCDLSKRGTLTVDYDLYIAQIRANPPPDMKENVESAMKALPEQFLCKVVYFNMKQHNAIVESEMSHFFRGSHGILQDNNGRVFIGQSTRQTTGIGLHIGSHFLPTVERGTVDLTNGRVALWNEAVFKVAGSLARVVYEQEMRKAEEAEADEQSRFGLFTMKRFAFEGQADDAVLQHLKDGFFFERNLRVLTTTGISSVAKVRKRNVLLSFLQSHHFLNNDLSPRHRALLVERCKIPTVSLQDLAVEFTDGVSEAQMLAFFNWWKTSEAKFENKKGFVEQLRSKGRLRLGGEDIMINKVKQYTFVTAEKDLVPPNTLCIPESLAPVLDRCDLDLFGWAPFKTLDWLEHCAKLPQDRDKTEKEAIGHRIFTVLIGPRGISCLSKRERDQATKLLESVECIRTDKGLKKPSESYFPVAGVIEDLPVIDDKGLSREVRQALEHIGVRRQVDWNRLLPGLESDTNTDTNGRLLQYLMDVEDKEILDSYIEDLRKRKVFASEKHQRLAPTDLYRPDVLSGKLRELGLPILELPAGVWIDVRVASMLEKLGVRKYPKLQKIVEWLSMQTTKEVVKIIARECLQLNKAGYRAEADVASRDTFIPTKVAGIYAAPKSVVRSPSWAKLGFDLISDSLQGEKYLLEVLGMEEDPQPAGLIDFLEHNPPNVEMLQPWLEQLESHQHSRKLHQLSHIPFIGIQVDAAHLEYKCPRDCFIISADPASSHLGRIFPIVNFGERVNQFLLSICSAKKGLPQASDITYEMARDPENYLRRLDNDFDRYRADLRDIAAKLDTLPTSLKHNMCQKRMLLATRMRESLPNEHELRLATDILVGGDKENLVDFGGFAFMAPEGLETLYKKLGSKSLDDYVKYIPRIYPLHKSGSSSPPFCRDCILRCAESFTSDGQAKGRQSGISLNPDPQGKHNLQVKLCSDLELAKKYIPPPHHLTEGKSHIVAPTRSVAAIFKRESKSDPHTLWIATSEKSDLVTDLARALCRLLLHTHRHRDLSIMKSLLVEAKIHPHRDDGNTITDLPGATKKSLARHGKKRQSEDKGQTNEKRAHPRASSPVEFDPVQFAKDAIDLCPEELPSGNSQPPRRYIVNAPKKDTLCKGADTEPRPDDNLTGMYGIRFFWPKNSRCQIVDPEAFVAAFGKFAGLLLNLGQVFQVFAPVTFSIIWKDKDKGEDLIGFNRDGHIFLNLAHYVKHNYQTDVDNEEPKVVAEWYFIVAHQIAHNQTSYHNQLHETTFAGLCVRHLNALYKLYPSCKKYIQSKQ